MPNGYMGKVLWIDLSDGSFKEEELPEELPVPIIEPIIEEPVIEEPEIQEEFIEEEPTEILEQAPTAETKKVKLGGFFGREITISKKGIKKDVITDIPEVIEAPEEHVSITALKPPKRRGTGVIRLCKICGATIQNTPNCPTCGARVL